jgi:hypothetical protein
MKCHDSTQQLSRALGILVLLLAAGSTARAVEVEARIDPTLIGVGQFVTLTLEARMEGGLDLKIEPNFSLHNLEIVAGPSQSQQVSFVNGRVSRSQTLTWTLRAIEVGTARVQNIRLSVNDEIFEMAEQVVEVQTEQVAQIDPFGRPRRSIDPFEDFFDPMRRRRESVAVPDPKLFLRAEATPKNPYVGQQVLYSLILFTQADIGAVSPDKMPDFEGLWSIEIEQPRRPKSVMTEVQGDRYGRVVLLQRALFPLRAGELRLDPVEARLVAKIPDYSWMGMVGSYDKEISLSSNAITLDVQPIPEAASNFGGAVGALELTAELEPEEIEVGEAATLSLTLSGRGHVDGLAGPQLPTLEGVRVFPPQTEGGDRPAGTTVFGTKTWRYVLVPERPGVWEIPIAEYAFFDPQQAAHKTTRPETKVLIARAASLDQTATSALEADPVGSEPLPITDQIDEEVTPTSLQPWLLAASGLLFVGLMIPVARRFAERRAATRHLRRSLKQAETIGKPRPAAQAIEEAWRQFLFERWEVPKSLAPGEWPQKLVEHDVNASTVDDFSALVDDLHYLRYAPELSAYESLRKDLVERSVRLAHLLA